LEARNYIKPLYHNSKVLVAEETLKLCGEKTDFVATKNISLTNN
jgi:hypothetical protein